MLLCVLLALSSFTLGQANMIRSDRVTNWGNWGSLDQCPPNSFVKAIDVKIEGNNHDNTALNTIRLSCVPLDHQVTNASFPVWKQLTSTEGKWGTFTGVEFCYRGVAVGFQERSQEELIEGDNTAANDVVLVCAYRNGIEKTMERGSPWGEWRAVKRCPPGTAVCGLQTQVQPFQGYIPDDTSLNNMDFLCCNLPNPAETCYPQDDWHEIISLDNAKGKTSSMFTVRKKIGVQESHIVTESSSVMEEIAISVGFKVNPIVLAALENNFEMNLSISQKTQHMWSQSNTSVFGFEHKETMEIEIFAHCVTTLYQVVGNCGPYVVHSDAIKRVDNCTNES